VVSCGALRDRAALRSGPHNWCGSASLVQVAYRKPRSWPRQIPRVARRAPVALCVIGGVDATEHGALGARDGWQSLPAARPPEHQRPVLVGGHGEADGLVDRAQPGGALVLGGEPCALDLPFDLGPRRVRPSSSGLTKMAAQPLPTDGDQSARLASSRTSWSPGNSSGASICPTSLLRWCMVVRVPPWVHADLTCVDCVGFGLHPCWSARRSELCSIPNLYAVAQYLESPACGSHQEIGRESGPAERAMRDAGYGLRRIPLPKLFGK
jgi:hypothetical protein